MTLIFFGGGGGGEEVRWKTVRTYGKILATPLLSKVQEKCLFEQDFGWFIPNRKRAIIPIVFSNDSKVELLYNSSWVGKMECVIAEQMHLYALTGWVTLERL